MFNEFKIELLQRITASEGPVASSSTPKMEAADASETLIPTQQTTRCQPRRVVLTIMWKCQVRLVTGNDHLHLAIVSCEQPSLAHYLHVWSYRHQACCNCLLVMYSFSVFLFFHIQLHVLMAHSADNKGNSTCKSTFRRPYEELRLIYKSS